MIFSLLFTAPRCVALGGLLVLALGVTSRVMAEEESPGVHPERTLGSPTTLPSEEKHDLTLRDAVHLTLQRNPELAAFAKEVRALEGATLQAGLLRNPDLAIDVEDLSSAANGVAQQFTTIRVSQLIELGGKRAARITTASLDQELANQDYETKRLEIIARVANIFNDVLAGQERLRLADDSVRLAQQVVNTVAKRIQAGKAPPIEETKAKIALSTARIEREQAQRGLAASRKQLSLLWGSPSPQFGQTLGDLESFVALPGFEVLAQRVRANPMTLRSMKGIEQRKALLELERSRRIPDITVSAGVRRYDRSPETTAVVGVSVPLPLFDRNQGSLREAHQRLDQAIDEQAATDLQLKAELAQTYEALLAAQNEIRILRDEVLPGARSAFDVANRGYELGKFGFLEMLDAQRTLFQNQVLYVRALVSYQGLVNALERLIAGPIDGESNRLDKGSGSKDSGVNYE